MPKGQPYGKGSRETRKPLLSRDQIIEIMRYLGWHTQNEDGSIPDDVFHVARELAGKVVEDVLLPSIIATAMDKYRAEHK